MDESTLAWLQRTLIHNGPAGFEAGGRVRHRFDGLAMLHRFTIADSGVSYMLDAETLEGVARAEAPHHIPFGTHGQFFDDLR